MLLTMLLSSQALRRRSRKYLRDRKLDLFVPTLPGFEEVTLSELHQLGLDASTMVGGAAFQGDLASVYAANLCLRSGNRVLLRIGDFLSQSYPMLYNRARQIPWEVLLGKCPEVSIDVSSRHSRLRHMDHIGSVIHDAITDRTHAFQLDPALVANGGLTIKARLYRDRCLLSLDTTGAHLHVRGYRVATTKAPLRETTAAAVLLAANSSKYDVIIDPFCGSGTITIEADMIARNVPPGAKRKFAIENSAIHSPGTYRYQRQRLLEGVRKSAQRILGFDISPSALEMADLNAARASTTSVRFERADAISLHFEGLKRPSEHGLIVANVPYGRRLGTARDAQWILNRFMDNVARSAQGWDVAIISPKDLPVAHPAVTHLKRIQFTNGGLPVVATLGNIGASVG